MLSDAPDRISFTSDLWSSIIIDGYMSIIAHFLDNNCVLQKNGAEFLFHATTIQCDIIV